MSGATDQKDDKVPSVLTSRLSKLNPFREKDDEGGDEKGEEVDESTVAGGGHATGGQHDIDARKNLRVSHALRAFLASQGEIQEADVGGKDDERLSPAVQAVLERPQLVQPDYVHDRSYALSEYIISSSHNTYLVGKQLYGKADSESYVRHLNAGARCVEIDAWDNDDDEHEPKVTHGYTLTKRVSFREVCGAINRVMDAELQAAEKEGPPAPIFISLENHCAPQGQKRLVDIMHEVFGDKLVSKQVHEDGAKLTLQQLSGRILVMVEYYGESKGALEEKAGKDDQSTIDEAKQAASEREAEAKPAKIIPELSALGVYAQSMKPSNDSWTRNELTDPENHLVNVEERAVLSAIEKKLNKGVAGHNARHLMRIYPKGTRIDSENLQPTPFWGVGAQVCALNWQTFDASMQLNEAMFAETKGWVLKPPHLRQEGGTKPSGKVKLTLEIAGATDMAVPEDRSSDIKPYITCTLYHPDNLDDPVKEKTSGYRPHAHKKLFGKEQPPVTSPVWDPPAQLTWTYEDDDLAFLRILVKSDDAFARNPAFLCSAVRLCSAPQGWHFVRLLDLKGAETHSTLLVRYVKTKARDEVCCIAFVFAMVRVPAKISREA